MFCVIAIRVGLFSGHEGVECVCVGFFVFKEYCATPAVGGGFVGLGGVAGGVGGCGRWYPGVVSGRVCAVLFSSLERGLLFSSCADLRGTNGLCVSVCNFGPMGEDDCWVLSWGVVGWQREGRECGVSLVLILSFAG